MKLLTTLLQASTEGSAEVIPTSGGASGYPYLLFFIVIITLICIILMYSSYQIRKEKQKRDAKTRSLKEMHIMKSKNQNQSLDQQGNNSFKVAEDGTIIRNIETMICKKCHKVLSIGSRFCSDCGTKMSN